MGLSNDGIAGNTTAQALCYLTGRLALKPQPLQQFNAFLSPSHGVSRPRLSTEI